MGNLSLPGVSFDLDALWEDVQMLTAGQIAKLMPLWHGLSMWVSVNEVITLRESAKWHF